VFDVKICFNNVYTIGYYNVSSLHTDNKLVALRHTCIHSYTNANHYMVYHVQFVINLGYRLANKKKPMNEITMNNVDYTTLPTRNKSMKRIYRNTKNISPTHQKI
jgi:hypothetical protein